MFEGEAGSAGVRFSRGIMLFMTMQFPPASSVSSGVEGTMNPFTGRAILHP